MLMTEIEIITDGGRRRRLSAADKPRIVEETMSDGESISAVARTNGVALNLLYRWRKRKRPFRPRGLTNSRAEDHPRG